jgi:hypothetical protein
MKQRGVSWSLTIGTASRFAERHADDQVLVYRDDRQCLRICKLLADPSRTLSTSASRSSLVDVAPVPDGDDDDQEYVVGDGADDAVVADTDPEARSSSQGARGWRARLLRQERDGALDPLADRWVELLQRANRGGTQLDAVGHVQPRSALT